MEEAKTLLLSERGFSDLYLCYCGQSRCMPLHNYGPAVRPNYIIHYITEGKGCFYEGGNRYELEAGQGFLIVPGQQTFYQADKEEPWTYLWVGFDGRNAEHYLKEIGLTSEKPVYRCENGKILQEIVGEMLEKQKASFSGQLFLEGLLYRFFAVLSEHIEMPVLSRQESENLYVKRAMEFIRNNYFEDIKVTDIADYVCVNRSYLYTLFQKGLHMSPSRYLAEVRMSQAEKLLMMTDFSVEVVARSCGYGYSLSFTRTFKEHFKMPPSQYRKEKRKEQI